MKDDLKLGSEAQRQAAEWVRELPEEGAPNLTWRAALNDSVRQEAERRARRRWRWSLARPVFGAALAATLAVVLLVPRSAPVEAPAGSRLEAGLIALHEDSVRTADIVGAGARPSDESGPVPFESDLLIDLDAGAL